MAPTLRRAASLKALNTFGVEARADRLLELRDAADLPAALELLRAHPPALVLGGGSNLLFTRDPPGTVLRVMLAGRRLLDEAGDDVRVEAAAGEPDVTAPRISRPLGPAYEQHRVGVGCHDHRDSSPVCGRVGRRRFDRAGGETLESRGDPALGFRQWQPQPPPPHPPLGGPMRERSGPPDPPWGRAVTDIRRSTLALWQAGQTTLVSLRTSVSNPLPHWVQAYS